MRIVLDTNILARANPHSTAWPGVCCLRSWNRQIHVLVLSSFLLREGKATLIAAIFIAVSLIANVSCAGERKKGHNFASKLFHFKNGVWTPAPAFADRAGFALSSRGILWIWDRSGELGKLDGELWTRYGKTQFGEPKDRLATPMTRVALQDDVLWKVTSKGVARFNGKSWRLYEEALKTDWPIDMVAGPSGVWIIDFYGNLSHFDDGKWTIQSLNVISSAPPPPGWNHWLDADEPPRLILTGDGRLWVFWHGLWRQDGEGWNEIRLQDLGLSRALLIGHDEDTVWLRSQGSDIVSVAADGTTRERYSWRKMGLSRQPEIRSLTVVSKRIWVATSEGLIVFDGQRWNSMGWPSDYSWIVSIAPAPDGSAWVRGVKVLDER